MGSKFKIVPENKEFIFKSLCPYCGGNLLYRATGWIEDGKGQWMVDTMDSECSTMPGFDSDDFEDWMNNHSEMPYVYQLPIDIKVINWINERYRFEID